MELSGLSEELDDDEVGRMADSDGVSGFPCSLWPILGRSRTINVQYCV